jgi:hypothetical protein
MADFTFACQFRAPGDRPAVRELFVAVAAFPRQRTARPALDLCWRRDGDGRLRAQWGLAAPPPRASLPG